MPKHQACRRLSSPAVPARPRRPPRPCRRARGQRPPPEGAVPPDRPRQRIALAPDPRLRTARAARTRSGSPTSCCSATTPSARSSRTPARPTCRTPARGSGASASTSSASAARSASCCAWCPSGSCRWRTSSCPTVVGRLADEERGIILVTGTTGSGKSTTLAAMIDRINRTSHKHVVTIEDPIEMLHVDRGLADQPARGRPRHRLLLQRPAARAAAGPRRDHDRGDPRPGHDGDRPQRRRDRPPGALDDAHPGRHRDGQPRDRLLPAAPAAAGAGHARRHPARDHLPAPGADRRRRRAASPPARSWSPPAARAT